MSLQELSPIFPLLVICLLKESLCTCDGTLWAKVGWEIFPEEMPYLRVQPSPSHCLPHPINKLGCNFANKDIFQGFLYLMYVLAQAIFLILVALSAHYLWMKWKKHKKKATKHMKKTVGYNEQSAQEMKLSVGPQQKKQASSDTAGNEPESQSINDIDQLLCKLLATTSVMTEYLNQASQHPTAKSIKHRKPKRKDGRGARGHHKHPRANVPQSNVETTQEFH